MAAAATDAPVSRASVLGMPKIELHVHLDGAFDAAFLYEKALALVDAGELPEDLAAKIRACDGLSAFEALVTCRPEERSLKAMLEKFMVFLPIVQGRSDVVEELAYRFVCRQAEQNVVYTEVRYSPHILTASATYGHDASSGVDVAALEAEAAAVVAAVTRGLRRGCEEHPVAEVRQVLCFIDGRPEWTAGCLELAVANAGKGLCAVVAVDVAAGEAHFRDDVAGLSLAPAGYPICPPCASEEDRERVVAAQTTRSAGHIGAGGEGNGAIHRAAMRRAAELGLAVTVHAGEAGPASNVAFSCCGSYGSARRVGHGYAMVADARLAEGDDEAAAPARVAAELQRLGVPRGLVLECCPTSSRATNGWAGTDWREHPVASMLRLRRRAADAGDDASAGALPLVTVSSDDPAVFGASLTDELALAADELGLGVGGLHEIQLNAITGAFLGDGAKAALRERFDAAWAAWASGG